MLEKIRRGIGLVGFLMKHVRPYRVILLVLAKRISRSIGISDSGPVCFKFMTKGKIFDFTVNDIEQFMYMYHMFYFKPFVVSENHFREPIIVDGGANIGIASLFFSTIYPNATIYAFEPSVENVTTYRDNMKWNENATIYNKALCDSVGLVDLQVSECSRYHSLYRSDSMDDIRKVESTSLSDWIRNENILKIDILKLNVEGAEQDVILGLNDNMSKVRYIVGEFHPEYLNEETFKQELTKRHFKINRFAKYGNTVKVFEAQNMMFRI